MEQEGIAAIPTNHFDFSRHLPGLQLNPDRKSNFSIL
jgi:hypothetical protein